jgi:hypothetical protein
MVKLNPTQIEMIGSSADLDLEAALSMARDGMKVIPVKPLGKAPLIPDWNNNASSDLDIIRAWRAQFPDCNFGIACGPSNLVVVDLDIKHGKDGLKVWRELTQGIFDDTYSVETPTGGLHFYYRGSDFRNSVDAVGSGIDVRGDGGFVVAPWSRTEQGIYLPRLLDDLSGPLGISLVPEGLETLLKARRGSGSPGEDMLSTAPGGAVSKPVSLPLQRALVGAALRMFTAHEGSRNDQLNGASFEVGKNLTDDPQTEAIVSKVLSSFGREIGLDRTEVANTIQSGLAAGKLNREHSETENGLFEVLDLAKWSSEPHPEPEVFGSGDVLSRPSLTWISGEPASGKSLLCMVWASDVIRAGGRVLWLDQEAGPDDTIGKFQALGMSLSHLQAGLFYLPPIARDLLRLVDEFFELVQKVDPDLIVIDSAAVILSDSGVDEDSNSGVSHFNSHVLLPLVKKMGHSVLVIDHVPKNSRNNRYPRGAASKLSAVDMSLSARTVKPFSKNKSGALELRVRKDRQGNFAEDTFWDIDVNAGPDGVAFDFSEPKDPVSKTAAVSDEAMREKIVDYIKNNPGASKTALEKVRGRKHEKKRAILQELLAEGVVVDRGGNGGASFHVEGSH